MAKLSIKDLELRGKTVFIRVDFNVPIENGKITSDKRIRASLPTIQYALEQGAGVVLASHFGRPKGKRVPDMSLAPCAARLAELLPGRVVTMAPDCIGPEVAAMRPAPGDVLLLENLRYHNEEEASDKEFAKSLASLCDLYVNDAFGSAHRDHASTAGIVAAAGGGAAGLLMDKEIEYLTRATQNPERPCLAILGGSKVSDKILVIKNLLKFVDRILIGGAMAYAFELAKGRPVGRSKVELDDVPHAAELLATAADKLMLPVDHVVAAEFKAGAECQTVTTIPDDKMALDIGEATAAAYAAEIAKAKTIICNGPMGVFEMPPFDKGTVAVFRAVADSGAVSVVGGGDSEKAVKAAGVADKMTHISTGGGATLEFLAGDILPGVAALTDK
jgi:phosphoglycerate kinase